MTNSFLLNDFYAIVSAEKISDNIILTKIQLNQEHSIFKGHFEQMPIVPGVCQTQMIKELLQQETHQNLQLVKGTNIKFTGMILPNVHPNVYIEISYKLENKTYIAEARLFFEESVFTKFKGIFSII